MVSQGSGFDESRRLRRTRKLIWGVSSWSGRTRPEWPPLVVVGHNSSNIRQTSASSPASQPRSPARPARGSQSRLLRKNHVPEAAMLVKLRALRAHLWPKVRMTPPWTFGRRSRTSMRRLVEQNPQSCHVRFGKSNSGGQARRCEARPAPWPKRPQRSTPLYLAEALSRQIARATQGTRAANSRAARGTSRPPEIRLVLEAATGCAVSDRSLFYALALGGVNFLPLSWRVPPQLSMPPLSMKGSRTNAA